MNDYEQLKQNFDQDGYVVIRSFLASEEVAGVSERISKIRSDILPRRESGAAMYEDTSNLDTIKQILDLPDLDPFFNELLLGERFSELAKSLLGDQVVPVGIQWFDKVPGIGSPTPAHQDGYYFMLEPNEAVTMWLALDDVDDSNGCVRYVPGSHRSGMRHHGKTDVAGFSQAISNYGDDDRSREVAVHAQPGDLLVHHSLTIHTAGGNKTNDRHRRAIGLVYYAQRAQQDQKRFESYQESLKSDPIRQGPPQTSRS